MKKKLAVWCLVVATLVLLPGCGISKEVKEQADEATKASDKETQQEHEKEADSSFEFFAGYGTVAEEHWYDISYVESAEVVDSTEKAATTSPYTIVVQFTKEGIKALSQAKEELLGRDLYLRIDDTVVAMVQIQEYMLEDFDEGKLTIVDGFITTKDQAQQLADKINAKIKEK